MQHIGFLVSTLSSPGGTGRVVANVANRMVDDYEVHVIGAYHSGDGEPAFAYDSRVHRLNILPKEPRIREANKELKKPLIDYIEQNHIEVLFLIGSYQGAYTMSTMPACKSCKFVFCDHGALMNEWNNKPIRFVRFLASVLSDMTAVLTQRSEQAYREKFHTPARKLRVIPNWIPNWQLASAPGYNKNSKRIMWAGRLDPEKGLDFLFEIAEKVLPSRPDWSWDVFGDGLIDGRTPEECQAEAHARGMGDQLRFCGSVPNLIERYQDYGIFALTSLREGLPMVLLEAKAFSVPLVSFDVETGPSEIIVDGHDGFLVPCYDCDVFAEKLAALMDDDSLRARFSEASQETVQKFSEDCVYEDWKSAIKQLTERGK